MLPWPIFHKQKKGSSKDWFTAVEIAELKRQNETQQLRSFDILEELNQKTRNSNI
jgi:hypothetical protein